MSLLVAPHISLVSGVRLEASEMPSVLPKSHDGVLDGVLDGLMAIYLPLLDCGRLLDGRLLDLAESHDAVVQF